MIGGSEELEDIGRVASSFPTYLGKIEATLLAGYKSLNFRFRGHALVTLYVQFYALIGQNLTGEFMRKTYAAS